MLITLRLRFELLFQKFLFDFAICFLKTISNDKELDANHIRNYFIIILKGNKQILGFIWGGGNTVLSKLK